MEEMARRQRENLQGIYTFPQEHLIKKKKIFFLKQIIKLYLVTTMTSPSQYIGKEVRERAIHTQT